MTVARSVARAVASPVARAVGAGIGGGYDTDALDYFTRAEGLGGTFATGAKDIFNAMVKGFKSDGDWSDIIELWPLCGVSIGGIKAKLKYQSVNALADSGTAFDSGDLTISGSGAGVTDGTNKYFDTQFALGDAGLTFAGGWTLGVYLVTNDATSNGRIIGVYDGASQDARITTIAGPGVRCSPGACDSTGTGFFLHSAKNGVQKVYKDGAAGATGTNAVNTTPTSDLHILGVNGLTGDTGNTCALGIVMNYTSDAQAARVSARILTWYSAIESL